MKIAFYHWSSQCPVSYETIQLLKTFEDQIEIKCYDISSNWELAQKQKTYYPFLTVFGGDKRWLGPLKKETIEKYLRGENFIETPYVIEQGQEIFKGNLIELNHNTFMAF